MQWAAANEVALDIESFLRTVTPTPDHYRSGGPGDIHTLVTEAGAATILSAP